MAANAPPTPDVALKPFYANESGPDKPGSELSIAAVVNDEVISGYDLDQRIKLIVGSSGVQLSPDELQRVRTQVLRELIDEKLKMQEAKRLKVEVKDQDILDQLNQIAQQNNTTVDGIKKELKAQGVSIYSLTDRIRVELAWNDLVEGRFSSEIKADPAEVQRVMSEMRANNDKPQYDVIEIFLAVDSPKDDTKVHQQAVDLVDQIKHGRAISQLAQTFSQSPSAANGGDLGWVIPGQLPPEVDAWIARAHRGQVSLEPIHTLAGYYIVGIKDTRNVAGGAPDADAPVSLRVISIPIDKFASADIARRAQAQLVALASKIKSCNGLEQAVAAVPGARVGDLGEKPLSALPAAYQQMVASIAPGTASKTPVRTDDGWETLVVCGREEEEAKNSKMPTEQQVAEQLMDQQISMLSRRYLRDLRRDAVIDSRIAEE